MEIIGKEWVQFDWARREIAKVYPPGQAAHHAEYKRFTAWRTRLPEEQRNKVTINDLPKLRGADQLTTTQLIERGADALAYEVLRNKRFEKMTDENGVKWVRVRPDYKFYDRSKRADRRTGLTKEARSERAKRAAKTRKERGTDVLAGAAAASGEARQEMGRRAHQTRLRRIREQVKDELRQDPEFMAEIKAQLRAEIESEVERLRGESSTSHHG